jgi:Mrp family chromosome partitioning ATPase
MTDATVKAGIRGTKHIIIVISGKGGVGKSTVACQLALSLAHAGSRVGVLDVDICGPSVPKICGIDAQSVKNSDKGWIPAELANAGKADAPPGPPLKVMSIAFLLPSANDAVVWRGPRKDAMIKQFIDNVIWGPLDYLIVDTPPGTSDEHLTLCEYLKGYSPTGAVVVTTPQNVSTDDVRKELSFCAKLKLRCLGIVENMAGFVCPCCGEVSDIFSRGGGEKLAEMYETPFLGRIPIDPAISLAEDEGRYFAATGPSATVDAVNAVVSKIGEMCAKVEAMRVAEEQPAGSAAVPAAAETSPAAASGEHTS